MANVKNNAAAKETCRKLIEAAGEVFADKGLHAATLQEITDRAGANKAAVNYHFRDKFELYAEVVRQGLTFGNIPPAPEDRRGTPEDQLRRFIARMVRQLLDPSQPPMACHDHCARNCPTYGRPGRRDERIVRSQVLPAA